MKKGFIYRRLARFFPVFISNVQCGGISLPNKHQIAGFAEVFCQPHYWRLFDVLEKSPGVVVDFGGNCGYFPVLSEIVSRAKFGDCAAKYYVFEALAENIPQIEHTVETAGIRGRTEVIRGAIGAASGEAAIACGKGSTLTAGVYGTGQLQKVPYVNLTEFFSSRGIDRIDVLKIDIEGSEHELFRSFPEFFGMVDVVLIELHETGGTQASGLAFMEAAGFRQHGPALHNGGDMLLVFRRGETGAGQ
jgi:FkbM family methyltransferase